MSTVKLYNTLTKKVDDFIPNDPKNVKMYTCGPTVYHFAHIGNLRSYIMEDILEKFLNFYGYNVNRVMNITDVGHLTSDADTGEDKMLKGAKREHKTVMEVAKYYEDAFFEDCKKLNIKKPETVVPATSRVDDFIKTIETLMEKGYAYLAGGNVYFDTSKLKNYYVLSNQDETDLTEAVRDDVTVDENKKNKTDFVLWFTKSKFDNQELKWDSPWGTGYPGWHIECSCISMRELGEHLDIHCGGVDNIFPHHTNEIAQSEACLGHKWCNYWFHVQHLNDITGKMSKSKGEFLTVSLIESKGYDPIAYRFFCLQSHYRKPLLFTYENLDNAVKAFNALIERLSKLSDTGDADEASFKEYREKFVDALSIDLNTSQAFTVLYDVLKADINDATKLKLIDEFDKVFSLDLIKKAQEFSSRNKGDNVDAEMVSYIEEMILKRKEAKKNKDFATADSIRDELKKKGVTLKDTREGTTWELE